MGCCDCDHVAVLDIRVPVSEIRDLWSGIARAWPACLGYVTSFLTIGGIWLAHHRVFRRLRFANARLMQVNLALLTRWGLCRFRPG